MSAADHVQDQDGRARAQRAARTAMLARRGSASREAGPARAYLVCACGSERYGIVLSAVAQVLPMRPCTPVPGAAFPILGLVALSGRIVSVVGLARALARPGAGRAEAGHLAVLRAVPVPVALAVDRALGIAHLSEADAPSAGFGSAAVSRYAAPDSGAAGVGDFVVIDLPRLLRRILP